MTEGQPQPSSSLRRHQTLALILVLLAALALRWGVVVAIPNFFGSGDPSIYYSMGRSCAREGVPRISFIWHLLTSPPKIEHVEDYCEPAFGYLLAVPLWLGGGSIVAAKSLSVACGTLAVLLVYWFARRFGSGVALLAAAFLAFEPWSIYYSGLIMKEATVTVVLLVFLEVVRRVLARATVPAVCGLGIGLLTVAASLFQYELLPILAAAIALTMAIHSRRLLLAYVVGTATGTLLLLALTWWSLGVPISAKVSEVFARLWEPSRASIPPMRDWTPTRFVPVRSVIVSVMDSWYPTALALAALGAWGTRVARAEATLLAAFCSSYLYFHTVAGDDWKRDFIPASAVLAPYAALAMSRSGGGWQMRPWAPACAGALLAFAMVGPRTYAAAAHLLPVSSTGHRVLAVSILAGAVSVAFAAIYAARRHLASQRLRSVVPAVLALALATNYHASLPWPAIYGNPQMPRFERDRAQRERVCHRIKGILGGRPVMTGHPAEVSLYAEVPSVMLPGDARTILAVRTRYRVPFLLVRAGQVPSDVIARLPVQPLVTSEEHTLYRFVAAP